MVVNEENSCPGIRNYTLLGWSSKGVFIVMKMIYYHLREWLLRY